MQRGCLAGVRAPCDDIADGCLTGHSAFSVAIKHLSGLHDDEVASLRAEICRLQALLRSGNRIKGRPPDMSGPRAYVEPLTINPHPVAESCSWSPRSLEEERHARRGAVRVSGRTAPTPPPEPALDCHSPPGKTDHSEIAGVNSEKPMANVKPKGAYLASIVEAAHEDVFTSAGKESRSILRKFSISPMLLFESTIGFVIVINALIIGISTDVPWRGWLWVDAAFFVIFSLEAILKVFAYGCRAFLCGTNSRWNLFEAALVLLALVELILGVVHAAADQGGGGTRLTSLARIVRLLRLTRIIRLARLEIFCDLVVIIRGTMGGMRTLIWSAVVISLTLYALALLFHETLGNLAEQGNGAENFATLPAAFFTMFRCVVAMDCNDVEGYPIFLLVSSAYGWGYAVVYYIVTLFMSFGLFNVIIAIFLEHVLGAAKTNEQLVKKHRLRDQTFLGNKMVELLMTVWDTYQKEHDVGHASTRDDLTLSELVRLAAPMEISPTLFEKLRQTSRVKEILSDLDVAPDDQANLFEALDFDGSGTIDVEELCEGIAKLRGDARRSDIVAVNLQIRDLQFSLHRLMSLVQPQFSVAP
mmetsp:Transcript_120049/g.299450  ORF Transcript_120049/g.299450 Transcript_120049/m.299450 type:complete len:587 (+) Transcript_120049:82-1842(+)